ncbi:MAG: peptidylprolyl isomerase [Defluviitaleaceae bacterium]|nr:peptidylprolyl isomerase [Defluviitaleaceae bacterium]
MKKFFKLTMVIAIVATMAVLLASCANNADNADYADEEDLYFIGENEPTNPNRTTTVTTIDHTVIEQMITDNVVVATVNGRELTAGDVSFQFVNVKSALQFEYFMMFPPEDDSFNLFAAPEFDYSRIFRDDKTFGQVVLEESVRYAANFSIFKEFAEQNNIYLTDAEIDDFQNEIVSMAEFHGEDTFDDLLRMDGIYTRQQLYTLFHTFTLIDKVIEAILDNEELFAQFEQYMPEAPDFSDDMLGAKHILITLADFDDEAAAEAFATEILQRAQAGEDFDSLIATYGQDPGMLWNPDGYTFVSGVMVPEFEQATRDLEMGEISGLVPTTHGIHIILRTEPDPDNALLPMGMQIPPLEQRMVMAIFAAFEYRADNAEIVFLPELFELPVM